MSISYTPEDIAWAVRCAVEVGADVVKTPYCGDIAAHRQIAEDCPVPLVAAGGPEDHDLRRRAARACGTWSKRARSAPPSAATSGDFPNITANVEAFKAVIHDRLSPAEAMARAGLA